VTNTASPLVVAYGWDGVEGAGHFASGTTWHFYADSSFSHLAIIFVSYIMLKNTP